MNLPAKAVADILQFSDTQAAPTGGKLGIFGGDAGEQRVGAIEILEGVIRDDGSLRIAVPTLALCYVQAGERERAAGLLKDDTLAAAEADSEMAYRLATYFAVEGDSSEALHWLRRAIYLGNENYPWFQKNPAWNNLRTNGDFERLLEDLKRGFRKNQKTWKRLLGQVPPEGE